VAIVSAAAFFLVVPINAFAVTSAEKQAEADEARAQLQNQMYQLEMASDSYNTAVAEHDAAVEAMNQAQQKLDATEKSIATTQGHLSSRAREMYRNGSATMLEVALSTTSYEDFVTTWDLLTDLNENDADEISNLKELSGQAQQARDEYDAQSKIAESKLEEAETAKVNLQASVDSYQAMVNALDEEVAQLIKAEEAAQAAANGASYDGNNPIVAAAFSKLGCTYSQGEYGPRTGPNSFDCSGLTQWCYAQVGISIPGTSTTQHEGMNQIPLSEAQPGDILWKPGHVAIYAGGDVYVHASDYGVGVIVSTGISHFVCALRP